MEIKRYDIPVKNGEPIKFKITEGFHWEKMVKYADIKHLLEPKEECCRHCGGKAIVEIVHENSCKELNDYRDIM